MSANINGTVGWRITGHARQRARSRGFGLRDVLLTAAGPDLAYEQSNYGPGRWVHQRGDIGAVVHRSTKTVITVLLRSEVQWDDEDARRRRTA